MSEFAPMTMAVAWMLDPDELMAGYAAGASGEPEPVASTYSLAYQHGWACGRVAYGLAEPTPVLVSVAYAFELGKGCADRCDANSGPSLRMQ